MASSSHCYIFCNIFFIFLYFIFLLRKKKCELGNNPKMGYDNSNGFELEMSFMLELHILHFVTMGDREPQGLSSSFPSSAQFLLDWDLCRNVFNIDLVLSINKKTWEGVLCIGGSLGRCLVHLCIVYQSPYVFLINIIYIVTTITKYHSHTTLVTATTVTKQPSHNLGHPHHSAKYEFMPLVTLVIVLSIIIMYP